MSFFFITNSSKDANAAKERWQEIYSNADSYILSERVILVTTNGFHKSKLQMASHKNGKLFCFGSIFSEQGFGLNEICKTQDFSDFNEEITRKLFGHYTLIIEEEKTIRIVGDRGGMINIFWSRNKKNDMYISNDLLMTAAMSSNTLIKKESFAFFTLNENTIGNTTVFQEVHRLRFENELVINGNKLTDKTFYFTPPEKLSLHEYQSRIKNYFLLLKKFTGRIATEVSAGFDTRLIIACLQESNIKFTGIVNDNTTDAGADIIIAEAICAAEKIELTKIYRQNLVMDEPFLLHSLVLGRNIFRSRDWLEITTKKYLEADLILGGYGGEVLRGKYTKHKGLKDFSLNYYRGLQETYGDVGFKILSEYKRDWLESDASVSNFLYACDRMRIWGGASLMGSLTFGHRLHPFMDWYLMSPLFVGPLSHMTNQELQASIISGFNKNLMNFPINPILTRKFHLERSFKKIVKNLMRENKLFAKFFNGVLNAVAWVKFAKLSSQEKLDLERYGFKPNHAFMANLGRARTMIRAQKIAKNLEVK